MSWGCLAFKEVMEKDVYTELQQAKRLFKKVVEELEPCNFF